MVCSAAPRSGRQRTSSVPVLFDHPSPENRQSLPDMSSLDEPAISHFRQSSLPDQLSEGGNYINVPTSPIPGFRSPGRAALDYEPENSRGDALNGQQYKPGRSAETPGIASTRCVYAADKPISQAASRAPKQSVLRRNATSSSNVLEKPMPMSRSLPRRASFDSEYMFMSSPPIPRPPVKQPRRNVKSMS